MRRKEREISDCNEIMNFIASQEVLRLVFNDAEGICITPMNYGYVVKEDHGLMLYMHGASEGRRAAAIKAGLSEVVFEIDGCHAANDDKGCGATYYYKSVIGKAKLSLVEDKEEKVDALDAIMDNIIGGGEYEYQDAVIDKTCIIRLDVTEWSCKANLPK